MRQICGNENGALANLIPFFFFLDHPGHGLVAGPRPLADRTVPVRPWRQPRLPLAGRQRVQLPQLDAHSAQLGLREMHAAGRQQRLQVAGRDMQQQGALHLQEGPRER